MTAMSVQLAGWAHLASRQHATCSEHGELIEVGDSLQTSVESTRQDTARFEASGSEEGHGHDHCLTAAHRHQRTASAAPALAPLAMPSVTAPSSRASDSATTSISLLSIAPKTSPPAHA